MASQVNTQIAQANSIGGGGGVVSGMTSTQDGGLSPLFLAGSTAALAGLTPASLAMDLLGSVIAEAAIEGLRELLSEPTPQDELTLASGPTLQTELAAANAPSGFIPSGNIIGFKPAAA